MPPAAHRPHPTRRTKEDAVPIFGGDAFVAPVIHPEQHPSAVGGQPVHMRRDGEGQTAAELLGFQEPRVLQRDACFGQGED